jgi:hypothetical protein
MSGMSWMSVLYIFVERSKLGIYTKKQFRVHFGVSVVSIGFSSVSAGLKPSLAFL